MNADSSTSTSRRHWVLCRLPLRGLSSAVPSLWLQLVKSAPLEHLYSHEHWLPLCHSRSLMHPQHGASYSSTWRRLTAATVNARTPHTTYFHPVPRLVHRVSASSNTKTKRALSWRWTISMASSCSAARSESTTSTSTTSLPR